MDARSPGGVVWWGWTDKLIHYGDVGRVDKLHSITTRQGVRERGTAHCIERGWWQHCRADKGRGVSNGPPHNTTA